MGKRKATDGQISLIGEIYNYKLKYIPHVEVSDTGEKVVVLRLPKEATVMERVISHDEADKLAGVIKTCPTKDYWRNKTRDRYRNKMLAESLIIK